MVIIFFDPTFREDTSYEHHVVVIYPEVGEVTQFVQNELLGFLENQWKYKTCMPQRDHDVGAGMKLTLLWRSCRVRYSFFTRYSLAWSTTSRSVSTLHLIVRLVFYFGLGLK